MNEWINVWMFLKTLLTKKNLYKMLLIKAKIEIIQSKLVHNLIKLISWQSCDNTYKIKESKKLQI